MNKKEINGCKERHEYTEKICPKCKYIFCYSCCAGTNVDEGGKYAPDYMLCPQCQHDYYEKEIKEEKKK